MKLIEQIVGTKGQTNGAQLDALAKLLFGSDYIGIYVVKTAKDVPKLQPNQIAILNRSNHWFGAWCDANGKLHETDSYHIDELGKKYSDQPIPKSFRQQGLEENCGQRLLTSLLFRHLRK